MVLVPRQIRVLFVKHRGKLLLVMASLPSEFTEGIEGETKVFDENLLFPGEFIEVCLSWHAGCLFCLSLRITFVIREASCRVNVIDARFFICPLFCLNPVLRVLKWRCGQQVRATGTQWCSV